VADWYTRPVVAVSDVATALGFYIGQLGFTCDWSFDEAGTTFVAQVSRDGSELILGSQWPARNGKSLLFVSLDLPVLEALRAELEGRGVALEEGWWGYDLMIVTDPDGNRLFFPYPNAEVEPVD
jgi:catechol 2,3-dioxygenase-like lactoylglutathione lyase family enzyme